MNKIYLDYAATTPTAPEVVEAMQPYFFEQFGNPSSIYSTGREAKRKLEECREAIAKHLGAKEASEIIFTGGGSEADNLAIKGMAWARAKRGNHIITSSIEHHAVMDACKFLQDHGFEITFLPVDGDGLVDPEDVRKAIRPETILITIMHANNEVGTIQPIAEIGRIAKEKEIPFHTDAVQTAGVLPIDVAELNCDLLSISAHKFYGPKGVGALYVRKGLRPISLIHGGAQERNRRAGTENLPGIVGMAAALDLVQAEREEKGARLTELRNKLIDGILAAVPHVRLNGHRTKRLPGNVNIAVEYVEGEAMLLNLDLMGIAASSGSACTSGSLEPSHVLLAMGLPHEIAHGSLRLTLGRWTTEEDVDQVLSVLPGIIEKLRAMSPLYTTECSCNRQ